jgi:hypothetical protein
VQSAAHEAATGHNSRPEPTPAQAIAGNYKKGRVSVHGLWINIENVRNSVREGKSEGKQWTNRMAAHYGEFVGTKGADGDPIDVYIGLFPESEKVWIINQRYTREPIGFDEHKVMLGFASEQQALDAYQLSFDRGWQGLASIYPCTVGQLKWWLREADHTQPFTPDQVSFVEGNQVMDKVLWDSTANPIGTAIHKLMYDLRVQDKDDGLLLDAVTMQDLMTSPDIDETPMFDALVVQVARMQIKMEMLQRVMEAANQNVKPIAMTISDPVRARGVMQVMVLFEMSDGQTISIWFHNPDTTPNKLTPMDELISWKWMLNKKDVTIVVAPERGKDLNIREVARRVMRLVERNSEAFKKANAKAAERIQTTEALKAEIGTLEAELSSLNRQIEVAQQVKADMPPAKVIAPEQASKPVGDGYEDAALAEAGVPADVISEMTDDGGYSVIMGTEKLYLKWQDTLDNVFGERIVGVRNALRELGWTGEANAMALSKINGDKITYSVEHKTTNAGAGNNVIGVTWGITGGATEVIMDMLKESEAAFAARISALVPVSETKAVAAGTPLSDAAVGALNAAGAAAVAELIAMLEADSLNAGKVVGPLAMAKNAAAQENRAEPSQDAEFAAAYEADAEALAAAMAEARAPATPPAKVVTPADISVLYDAGSLMAAFELWQVNRGDDEDQDLMGFVNMWWNDHGQAELWKLPVKTVKGWTPEEYEAAHDVLEDWNFHPEALLLDAKRNGNSGDVKEASSILNDKSTHRGSMTLLDRRAALGKKLRGEVETAKVVAAAPAAGLIDAIKAKAAELGIELEVYSAADGAIGITLQRGAVKGTLEQRKAGESWSVVMHEDNPRSSSSADFEGCLTWFVGAADAVTPAADPPKGYGADVVTVYGTKSGKEAMVIKSSESGKYSWMGAYGAGSGHSFEVMLAEVDRNKLNHPGMKLVYGKEFVELGAQVKGDISYRAKDDMFTSFYPESEAGLKAWKVMAAHPESGSGIVQTAHVPSVIAQLEKAGLVVIKAPETRADDADELMQQLNDEFFSKPKEVKKESLMNAGYANYAEWERAVTDLVAATTEVSNGDAQGIVEAQATIMSNAWAASSDASTTAAAVLAAGSSKPSNSGDTFLPAGWTEAAPGRIATSTDPITGGIVDKQMVSGEWFVIPENKALTKIEGFTSRDAAFEALAMALARLDADLPQDGSVPVNASVATDTAYLNTLIDGTADMLDADIFDKLEPMFAKYAENADMLALVNQAAQAYSDATVKAAQQALAG